MVVVESRDVLLQRYRIGIPYNPTGLKALMAWDPAMDEAEGNQCKAYGAPGVMRQPTRLRISWQNDNALKIETDFGTQTRLIHFNPSAESGPREPSWQGYSTGSWTVMGGAEGVGAQAQFERGGILQVTTTRLRSGYYWRSGAPYTGDAVLTEHFRVMELPDGGEWILLSQRVEDPAYLRTPFVTTYHFRKLRDNSQWNPTSCSVR
jgi:hypothetical protein